MPSPQVSSPFRCLLSASMVAISQAFFTSFSPLTLDCYFPLDSCVGARHWRWTRQTQSLSSKACCSLEIICGWSFVSCEKHSRQSRVLVYSNSSGIKGDDEVCLRTWGGWWRKQSMQAIHSYLHFLLILGSNACLFILLLLMILCFYYVPLVIMRASFSWPSNHSFF